MSDIATQRDLVRRLEQTQVVERPGTSGYDTFYASGTWAPTLVGSGTAGTFTYDATNTGATYTRIGNRVFIEGRLRITAIAVAPTGNLSLAGLPITSTSTAYATTGTAVFGGWQGITLTAGHTELAASILSATTTITLFESGSNVAVNIVQGTGLVLVGGVADFRFTGSYQA